MSTWIDFKALRDALSFPAVLESYGLKIMPGKNQFQCFCPLPCHTGARKKSPSFSANLHRKCFQCFSCGASGNVIDFVALMEGLDPSNGRDLRKAALLLKQKFALEDTITRTRNPKAGFVRQHEKSSEGKTSTQGFSPRITVRINAPLDFHLKDLDPNHPYLKSRGFDVETITHFGLGFCSRGFLAGRIAIPIFNSTGELVAFAGRSVSDANVTSDNPKYLFPSKRERNGTVFEFKKSMLLYNSFRICAPADDLIIVEGFASVWWLHQNGIKNVIATMGASCSAEQALQVVSLLRDTGRAWIISDGDSAGLKFGESVIRQIAPKRFVRWIQLPDGKQPTDCTPDELQSLLL